MSLIKACCILVDNNIPPTIHCTTSFKHDPIVDGRIQVVKANTVFEPNIQIPISASNKLIVVNNFGFGGTNAMVVGQRVPGIIVNMGEKKTRYIFGRTKECLQEYVSAQDLNDAAWMKYRRHSALLAKYPWRGVVEYTIDNGTEIPTLQSSVEIIPISGSNSPIPVAFCYSGQGSQWNNMGKELYSNNTLFRTTIEDACVDLPFSNCLWNQLPEHLSHPIHSVGDLFSRGSLWMDKQWSGLGITSVQVGLTAILRDMGISPDYIFGHSVGEVAAGYADGCTSAREAARIAFVRCECAIDAVGLMCVVGLTYTQAMGMISDMKLEEAVTVGCHNSPDGVTLSGTTKEILQMKELLTNQGIFARIVPTGNLHQ